ncbi:MAG TPA: nitrilase-related carbon-nitrogen hydrolase, partial [Rhodothermales bacterium]|nr:nitrilase-related carbon-nitrogen hydrolase [Rhodothermales bacterium]
MKIALAQINPIVGDLRGNGEKIIDYARRAEAQGADLVIFPEMCVVGYPLQDLLDNPFFLEATQQAIEWIACEVPQNVGVIIGAPVPNPSPVGKRVFNAAFLYEGGERIGTVYKTLLPTYDVFDEYRHFEPAPVCTPVAWRGLRLGLHICEDMWNNEEFADYHLYARNPIDELAAEGIDLFVNISASPFALGKHEQRNRLIEESCREHGVPFVLVNQVGANTEIIFDGDSRVHAADGTRLLCAPSFEEHLMIWDTEANYTACPVQHDDIADLHDALTLGIRDYFYKTGAFTK